MKRSEYRAKRLADYSTDPKAVPDPWLDHDCEAAEAAGVVWDPEEPELPERLEVYGVARLVCSGGQPWGPRVAAETKRRYNAWLKLRQRVEPIALSSCPSQGLAKAILAILDGKEE